MWRFSGWGGMSISLKDKMRQKGLKRDLRAFFSGGQNKGVLFVCGGQLTWLFIYYIV